MLSFQINNVKSTVNLDRNGKQLNSGTSVLRNKSPSTLPTLIISASVWPWPLLPQNDQINVIENDKENEYGDGSLTKTSNIY